MPRRAHGWLAAMLVGAVFLGGCLGGGAGGDDEDAGPWHGRDLTQPGWQSVQLEFGAAYEVTYRVPAGTVLEWDWVTAGQEAIDFSVHTHDARGADVYHNSTKGPQHIGRLVVPTTGAYGMQWGNAPRDTTLHLRIPAGGTSFYFPPSA